MDVQILIVDDHPTVRESLRFVFAAAGMKQIREATNCEQAIRIVRDHEVDLLLLDVSLGDGRGLDALREIKAIDDSIPVLIHSFDDSARLLSRAFHLGAAGYVVKGQDKNSLIHAVQRAAAGASLWTSEQLMEISRVDAEPATPDRSRSVRNSSPIRPPRSRRRTHAVQSGNRTWRIDTPSARSKFKSP